MTKLPNTEFRKLIPQLREKGFYKSQRQRKISWPEYNLAQIQEAEELLIFIREEVDKTKSVSLKGKVGRPLTNPKSLVKAICELLGLPERQTQGWIRILGPFLGIYQNLDDKVIDDAYRRPEVTYILKQIFEKTKESDGTLSGDGTGIETSRKQNYESTKKANAYMTSIVDSREIVQAFDISGKQECKIMHSLIKQVKGHSLRLDAGFVDRKLTTQINQKKHETIHIPKEKLKAKWKPSLAKHVS